MLTLKKIVLSVAVVSLILAGALTQARADVADGAADAGEDAARDPLEFLQIHCSGTDHNKVISRADSRDRLDLNGPDEAEGRFGKITLDLAQGPSVLNGHLRTAGCSKLDYSKQGDFEVYTCTTADEKREVYSETLNSAFISRNETFTLYFSPKKPQESLYRLRNRQNLCGKTIGIKTGCSVNEDTMYGGMISCAILK